MCQCCCLHPHTAVKYIAFKSLIFALVKIAIKAVEFFYLRHEDDREHHFIVHAFQILERRYEQPFWIVAEAGFAAFLFLASILLLYGRCRRKPAFYWPMLLYALMDAIWAVVNIVLFSISAVQIRNGTLDIGDEDADRLFFTVVIMIGCLLLFYIIRTYVYLIIVNRARIYLANESEGTDWKR